MIGLWYTGLGHLNLNERIIMNFEVVTYWEAIAAKAGDPRKWTDLPPQHQHLVIQSIKMLLHVLHEGNQNA